MSLTSSLFAITVQQWLREYRLPGHISLRERVRLRQYRYSALQDWRVPQIVSMLPILLQVAVVLFLTGLCLLLSSLDETVAKAFTVFIGVVLSVYATLTLLPVTFRHCPYKSPVTRGIIIASKLAIVIIKVSYSLLILPVLSVMWFIEAFATVFRMPNYLTKVQQGTVFAWWNLVPKLFDFRIGLGDSYWTARELDHLPTTKHLDRDALIWAPSAVSKADLPAIDQCLHELIPQEQLQCICSWAAQALNFNQVLLKNTCMLIPTPFDRLTLEKIDHQFCARFRSPLLRVLDEVLASTGGRSLRGSYFLYQRGALIMLRQMARGGSFDTDSTRQYASNMMRTRATQTRRDLIRARIWIGVRLPTVCLFEISTLLHYRFSEEEIARLIDHAEEIYSTLKSRVSQTPRFMGYMELMLVSIATALHAISCQQTLLQDPHRLQGLTGLLLNLDKLIVDEKEIVQYIGTIPEDRLSRGILWASVPACISICKSVVALAEANLLSVDGVAPESLVDHMLETFQSESAFEDGVTALLELREKRHLSDYVGPSTTEDVKEAPHIVEIPAFLPYGSGGKVSDPDDRQTENKPTRMPSMELSTIHDRLAATDDAEETAPRIEMPTPLPHDGNRNICDPNDRQMEDGPTRMPSPAFPMIHVTDYRDGPSGVLVIVSPIDADSSSSGPRSSSGFITRTGEGMLNDGHSATDTAALAHGQDTPTLDPVVTVPPVTIAESETDCAPSQSGPT